MNDFKSLLDTAREALDETGDKNPCCGYCKWLAFPENVCLNPKSPSYGKYAWNQFICPCYQLYKGEQ